MKCFLLLALTEVSLTWDPDRRSGSVQRSGSGAGQQYQVVAWKVTD